MEDFSRVQKHPRIHSTNVLGSGLGSLCYNVGGSRVHDQMKVMLLYIGAHGLGRVYSFRLQ